MPRVIRARDAATVLAAGGHEPPEYDPDYGWEPGYRVAQAGRRRLHITRP